MYFENDFDKAVQLSVKVAREKEIEFEALDRKAIKNESFDSVSKF